MEQASPAQRTKPTRQRFDDGAVSEIIGYQLRRAQIQIFQEFMARFASFDMRPSEYSVMALIASNPGSKQIAIAEALGIKRANFVALINTLEARGLVERRQPANDRRSHALFLTSVGISLMEKLDAAQAEFEADCIARLGGTAERDQLMELLSRLTDQR
ncbi:MarR family winged helix-turn-helix transcriptional regulator [Devosia neptuniae]|uniref:MarR family winged helix-turn-helix transcriptional regulator n=1 Tax=Devosia neptuniae TaxID=191302 RepID=UPI0022B063D6|nr:MarR family winged helix-turn-helix transcriptional regulator [Devosia neptuniae]MCZ4346764.1 MarR family winged helix-turn-helix transcriptional regulator [Devosia neptuniae]